MLAEFAGRFTEEALYVNNNARVEFSIRRCTVRVVVSIRDGSIDHWALYSDLRLIDAGKLAREMLGKLQ